MSGHMADAGGEVVAANGFGTRIMMIDKDARRMDVVSALLAFHQGLLPAAHPPGGHVLHTFFLLRAKHHPRTCHWQVRQPDGTPPDMERKADILVYEVLTLQRSP